MKMKYNL